MSKMNNEFKGYLKHFPKGISKTIESYANEEVFKYSRYIFTRRKGKQQYGYCTHCRKEFETTGLRHNQGIQCPKCKSSCTVKASGIRRESMVDEAYFVYYEKSIKNPGAIVARGFLAVRDYRGDYTKVKTKYLTITFYVFEMGNSVMLRRYGYYSKAGTMESFGLKKCSTVFSPTIMSPKVIVVCSHESIKEAVKDTPFRYSTWESYDDWDMVKFFSLYSMYQCIEYLTKIGLKNLVETKLYGEKTYSAINWRATTLLDVLRLSKDDLAKIKGSKNYIDPLFLRLFQISKKDGSNLTIAEIDEIKNEGLNFEYLQIVIKYASLRQIRNYINRQYKGVEKGSNQRCGAFIPLIHSKSQILSTWKDYIADCVALDMNLSDERILFPKDLFKAHQDATKRVKSEENKLMDENIKARLADLNYYCFEYRGLFIRPAMSTKELIEEGKALGICVGNYANQYMTRYSKGKIILLLIRKLSEPEIPFYTMELRKGEIIQTQGKQHRLPTKEVSKFIEAFKAEKLQRKKSNSRIRITA